jgi:membrane protein involved in colicin uptake
LARKPNYDFEKRKKEQDRKAKKDAKREERLARKRAGQDPDLDGIVEGAQPAEGEPGEGEPADAEDADEITG